MKVLVLYHAPCMDGLFAAVAAYKVFGNDAEYIGVSYNDELGREAFIDRDVYMVDFSTDRESLLDIARYAHNVIIIDHHVSAQKALSELPRFELHNAASLMNALRESRELLGVNVAVHFDMTQSGAALSWRHFIGTEDLPWLIARVQDRDLWKFELEGSRELHEWLSLIHKDRTLAEWLREVSALEDNVHARLDALKKGSILLAYQYARIHELADKAEEGLIFGIPAMIVNAPGYMASDLGNHLCIRHPDHVAVIYQTNSKLTNVSLRSSSTGPDVSKIASTMGGGGHMHAAGFKTDAVVGFPFSMK